MSDDPQAVWHSERQEAFERTFAQLPTAGSPAYWQAIEQTNQSTRLALEVLARCVRERYLSGNRADAERAFAALAARIQHHVDATARKVASSAHATDREELAREIASDSLVEVWSALVREGEPFFLTGFGTALVYAEQHAAHANMQAAGEWHRRGTVSGKRIPATLVESIDQERQTEDGQPLANEIADPQAARDFDQAELREDALALLATCSPEDQQLLIALYWRDERQDKIAAQLGITDRTVRNRLDRVLKTLRVRALEQEDSSGTR